MVLSLGDKSNSMYLNELRIHSDLFFTQIRRLLLITYQLSDTKNYVRLFSDDVLI